jgi:hypothetical protein
MREDRRATMIKKVQANNYRKLDCLFGIDFLKQQRDGHHRVVIGLGSAKPCIEREHL